MNNNTSRFTHLLGECRRQMNGAVVGSMRYYGAEYGLNYGVSLPTIRSLAQDEGKDHTFAKYLYVQQVREIRLCALHIATPEAISATELDFWAEGIVNSEVAEEASFALFQYVDCVKEWIESSNELLVYTALLSISKCLMVDVSELKAVVVTSLKFDSMLITTAIVTLLESYYRHVENQQIVDSIISELPASKATTHINEEMSWRCECYK